MANEIFHEVVPVILKHDDLNSMYYSVENRSPYLDKNLFNFAMSLPPQFLIEDAYQKKILRDSAKNILHDKIRLDRVKKGFNASISSLINFKKNDNLNQIFHNQSPIHEYVDLNKLQNEIDYDFIPNHYSKFLFSIISTNYFLELNS